MSARRTPTVHASTGDGARLVRRSVAGIRSAPILLVLSLARPVPAPAQDFSAPAVAGPASSPLVFIERGLPDARGATMVHAAAVRWYGLPDLTTRAAALGVGWRSLRAAGAISQSGDAELGWDAAGLACGAGRHEGGAALRGVARRERRPGLASTALGPGVGVEVGAGGWVQVGWGLKVWADAPQLWIRGEAPPLRRALEIGGLIESRGVLAWWSRRAPGRASDSERCVGIGLGGGPWTLWLDARDRPLRGGAGFSARVGRAVAGLGIESHPVLGETVRLSIGAILKRGDTHEPAPPGDPR